MILKIVITKEIGSNNMPTTNAFLNCELCLNSARDKRGEYLYLHFLNIHVHSAIEKRIYSNRHLYPWT